MVNKKPVSGKLIKQVAQLSNGKVAIQPNGDVITTSPISEILPDFAKRVIVQEFLPLDVSYLSFQWVNMQVVPNGMKDVQYQNIGQLATGNSQRDASISDWDRGDQYVYEETWSLSISDEQSSKSTILLSSVSDFGTSITNTLNPLLAITSSIKTAHDKQLDTKNFITTFTLTDPNTYFIDTSALDAQSEMKLIKQIITISTTPQQLQATTIGTATNIKLERVAKKSEITMLLNSEFESTVAYDVQSTLFKWGEYAEDKIKQVITFDFGSTEAATILPEIAQYKWLLIIPTTKGKSLQALRHYNFNKYLPTAENYDVLWSYIKQNTFKYADCVLVAGGTPIAPAYELPDVRYQLSQKNSTTGKSNVLTIKDRKYANILVAAKATKGSKILLNKFNPKK